MKSIPSGSSFSLCQTIAGFCPVTCSSATARSRSQLEPGKTMTALFIVRSCQRNMRETWHSSVLEPLDPEILNNRIGQQLPAHILDFAVAGAVRKVELDQLARADVVDAGEAEPFECVVDSLTLRIEDP